MGSRYRHESPDRKLGSRITERVQFPNAAEAVEGRGSLGGSYLATEVSVYVSVRMARRNSWLHPPVPLTQLITLNRVVP